MNSVLKKSIYLLEGQSILCLFSLGILIHPKTLIGASDQQTSSPVVFDYGQACSELETQTEQQLKQLVHLKNSANFAKFCRAETEGFCVDYTLLFDEAYGYLKLDETAEFCRYIPASISRLPPGSLDLDDPCLKCG